jgi:hypothetical protein
VGIQWNDEEHTQEINNDAGKAYSGEKHLSVAMCFVLLHSHVNAEEVVVSFDYLRMHRQCWRLLRAIRDHCRDDLHHLYGADHITKGIQLPSVIAYMLITASQTEKAGELMRAQDSVAKVTRRILERVKSVVKSMIAPGESSKTSDRILPKMLSLQVDL